MGNAGSSNNNGGRVHTTTAKKQIDAGDMVPNVTLKVRIRRLSEENKEIFEWRDVQSFELFRNKKIVMFAIAGGMSSTPKDAPSHAAQSNLFRNNQLFQLCALAIISRAFRSTMVRNFDSESNHQGSLTRCCEQTSSLHWASTRFTASQLMMRLLFVT